VLLGLPRARLVPEPPEAEASQVVQVRRVAPERRLLERRSLVKVTRRVVERPKQGEVPKASPPGVEVTYFVEESQELPVLKPETEGMTRSSSRLA